MLKGELGDRGTIPDLSHPVGFWGVEMGAEIDWTELVGRARSHQCREVPEGDKMCPGGARVWPGDARKQSDTSRRCHGTARILWMRSQWWI